MSEQIRRSIRKTHATISRGLSFVGSFFTFTSSRRAMGVVTQISIIVGIVAGLGQTSALLRDVKIANMSNKLASMDGVERIMREDQEVQRRAIVFVDSLVPALEGRTSELVSKYGSGKKFYHSKELKDYSTIVRHYEKLGALVKLGYVDFEILFEVVPFPDDFWNQTEEIRKSVGGNWLGRKKPMADFGSNTEFLRNCYQMRRNNPTAPVCVPAQPSVLARFGWGH